MSELLTLPTKVLLAWWLVLAVGWLLAQICRRVGQPTSIGEIAAGIMLGPSLLGWLWPQGSGWLFTNDVLEVLQLVAHAGIVLFVFYLGLHLDFQQLRLRARQTSIIAFGSMAVPLVVGFGVGLAMAPIYSGPAVTTYGFAFFMGVALSITAFPVLARILADRQMIFDELSQTALMCAAMCDLAAWCLLALLTGVATAEFAGAMGVVGGAALFVIVMVVVVRPMLTVLAHRQAMGWGAAVALLVLAITTGLALWIGIHGIVGALLCGLLIPRDSRLASWLGQQIERYANPVLLPAFFVISGFRVELSLFNSAQAWVWCVAITALATVSKLGGTYIAARCVGQTVRQARVLAVLMNTRGLMELIVLNLALELNLIAPILFAMLVVMAIATTLMTGPLMTWVHPKPASGGTGVASTQESMS